MIDLHCHILPGVDDGAATEDESLRMARLAVESGVTELAVTPHCNVPGQFENYLTPGLVRRMADLQKLLDREGVPLKLRPGMEVFVTEELPGLLEENKLLTLGQSRYLLVEFGFGESVWFVERMLRTVAGHDLVPVIAHPERYYFVQDDPRHLLRWAEEGCVLQLNKGSFFGMFGRRAARAAHWCLDRGCIHLIGSDGHSPYRRTPRLNDIYDLISDIASPELAELLLRENPADLLADRLVRPAMAKF